MSPPEWPSWVIVGAGCAGLSLAVHRVRADPSASIVLVDPRRDYNDDRTWCAFRCDDHAFTSLVEHRWHRVRVRLGSRDVVASLHAHPYERIAAGAFYEAALAELRAATNVRFEHAPARDVWAEGVRTEAGVIRGGHVFDSRPYDVARACAGGLAQCFSGAVLQSETPRFDPEVATLMDFDPSAVDHVRFRYTLPFDAHTALVEDTVFALAPMDVPMPTMQGCEVLRTERGVLPMTTAPLPDGVPGVTRIGLRGGAAKASSGYVFDFIQRHSAALINDPKAPVPRALRHRLRDEVFLSAIAADPASGADLFVRLFEPAGDDPGHADRIARFMMEASSLEDEARVMNALPWAPLALRALGAPARWMRTRSRRST